MYRESPACFSGYLSATFARKPCHLDGHCASPGDPWHRSLAARRNHPQSYVHCEFDQFKREIFIEFPTKEARYAEAGGGEKPRRW